MEFVARSEYVFVAHGSNTQALNASSEYNSIEKYTIDIVYHSTLEMARDCGTIQSRITQFTSSSIKWSWFWV